MLLDCWIKLGNNTPLSDQADDHDDTLLRRAMLFNHITAMKRLYDKILKANAIFLQSSLSRSNRDIILFRVTQLFRRPDPFSMANLCQSTLTALLSIVEQALENISEYDTCVDVVVVTGASSRFLTRSGY